MTDQHLAQENYGDFSSAAGYLLPINNNLLCSVPSSLDSHFVRLRYYRHNLSSAFSSMSLLGTTSWALQNINSTLLSMS